jgi:hypothetical protein
MRDKQRKKFVIVQWKNCIGGVTLEYDKMESVKVALFAYQLTCRLKERTVNTRTMVDQNYTILTQWNIQLILAP